MTLIAATVQGALGFGFTLLAVSFFLLIIGSTAAIQLLVTVNFAISLALLGKVRKDLDRALWGRLVVGAGVGVPIGLAAFTYADVDQLSAVVAIVILVFVVVTAFRATNPQRQPGESIQFRTPSALSVGMIAGGMTTAVGMPGPPLVLYLTSLGAGKDQARSITLTFFAVSYGVSLLLQTATTGIDRDLWISAAVLTPVAGAGAALGHILAGRISEPAFRNAVLILVGLTGVYVLLDVVRS